DEEVFVWLNRGVAVDLHRNGLRALARREGQGAVGGLVVVVGRGGRAVGGRVGHRDIVVGGGAEGHREDVAGGAAVALVVANVVDADAGPVHRTPPDGNRARGAAAVAVFHRVAERVGAVEVRVRRVADRAVGVDR